MIRSIIRWTNVSGDCSFRWSVDLYFGSNICLLDLFCEIRCCLFSRLFTLLYCLFGTCYYAFYVVSWLLNNQRIVPIRLLKLLFNLIKVMNVNCLEHGLRHPSVRYCVDLGMRRYIIKRLFGLTKRKIEVFGTYTYWKLIYVDSYYCVCISSNHYLFS